MSATPSFIGSRKEPSEAGPRFGWSIALSILLIVSGIVAIMLEAETTIAIVIIMAYALMAAGIIQMVYAFRGKGVGHTIWKAVVAIAYFLTGLFLRVELGIGLVVLTVALILFFLVEGVMSLVTWYSLRKKGGSGWLLFNGVLTLLLAFLIWFHWPTHALTIIGLLVGINLLINGTTRLMLTLAARRVWKAAEAAGAPA